MKRKSFSTIEQDTPLLPYVIAESVARELIQYLHDFHGRDKPLGNVDAAIDSIVERADRVYQHNPTFRKQMQSQGNKGRDALYSWMRHWLAAYALDHWPDVFPLLPESYRVGADLPGRKVAK